MKIITAKFRLAQIAALVATPSLPAVAHPDSAPAPTAPATTGQSVPVAADTAVGVVDAFHAALKRNDSKTALGLLSEEVMIFESGSVENSRAEYAAHHLKSDAEFSAATIRTPVSQHVTKEGNMATVMRVEIVTGNFRGRPVNSRSVETMVLNLTDAGWRIVHIHWSSADRTDKIVSPAS